MTALAGFWFPHLLQALWQNTAAALIVLGLLRAMRGASPRLRHALVLIALVKFAIPPMLALPTGIFSAAPPAPSIAPVRAVVIAAMQPEAVAFVIALMLLHLGGTALAMARLIGEAWRLQGIRRRARNDGEVLLSDEISVPMTTGVLRPVILLPANLVRTLTTEELRDVIAHEREHVRRRDVLLNWLQELVIALWWFHPLVHFLGAEARTVREECCDDALLARGTCEPAQYARTLLQAATFAARPPVSAAAIAESPHTLLRRVRRIAERRTLPPLRLGAASILIVAAAALLLLPGLRVSSANRIAFDHAMMHAIHNHR